MRLTFEDHQLGAGDPLGDDPAESQWRDDVLVSGDDERRHGQLEGSRSKVSWPAQVSSWRRKPSGGWGCGKARASSMIAETVPSSCALAV